MEAKKPGISMSCRKRRRPAKDPRTDITYARQVREVSDEYLMVLGDDAPKGTFDLEFWAQCNDATCAPWSGGISNPTSMAAVGGVSVRTLVNSVFPSMVNSLYREGPVAIAGEAAIRVACGDYKEKMRARQSEAGRRNAANLAMWGKGDTDQSSGSLIPAR